ncbi:MAG: ParB/RepB/Spo0J family partition protein [Elusimicrobiales bacterium]
MRQALGKGLDALFRQTQTGTPENAGNAAAKIPINKIKPNRFQPRQNFSDQSIAELAESIKLHGLAQPVVVVYDRETGEYELVAGERRLRACKLAGLEEIDAVVRPPQSDEKMLALSLVENIQREDLNPVDTALAYSGLVEKFGVSQSDLARYCGKSRAAVSNSLRILELEPEIRKSIQTGLITEGHARALLTAHPRTRLRLFGEIVERKYTVRQAEDTCRRAADGGASGKRPPACKAADTAAAEQRISRALGEKTEIRPARKAGTGTLVIRYSSTDSLNAIYRRLTGEL